MQPEIESQFIHAFPRGKNEKIQLNVRKYKDRYYLDIRLWFQTPEDPQFRPTRKGVSFPLDFVNDLQQGIDRLKKIRSRFRGQAAPTVQ